MRCNGLTVWVSSWVRKVLCADHATPPAGFVLKRCALSIGQAFRAVTNPPLRVCISAGLIVKDEIANNAGDAFLFAEIFNLCLKILHVLGAFNLLSQETISLRYKRFCRLWNSYSFESF